MNTLREVLEVFDNPEKKKFDYHEISSELSLLPEEQLELFEVKAESLAMQFQDNTGKDHWGTFLGPLTTWKRKDTGEEILCPDKRLIIIDHIDYWERRSVETCNPLMKMRYLGLVFDFKNAVTGTKPNYHSVILPYIDALLNVVKGDYPVHELSCCYILDRALQLASQIRNNQLFEDAQQILWDFDHKYGIDEKAGIWGEHFRLMLKYRSRYGKYEDILVQENEERFDRFEKQCLSDYNNADKFVYLLGIESDLLCDYYRVNSDKVKVKNLLDRELNVISRSFPKKGGMWAQAMLQTMQSKYRKSQLYKEANRLYVDIQNFGNEALEELHGVEISVPIDNDLIDRCLNVLMTGKKEEVLVKYILSNIPIQKKEKQLQKEEAEQSPLLDFVKTITYDSSGFPINNIGGGVDPVQQKYMYNMCQHIHYQSIIVRLEVEKLIENDILNLDVVLNLYKDSPLILDGQREILRRGMQAYFENDYLVACHLLIPLFESVIRNIVAICGGEILQPDVDSRNGNRYISLEGLLNSEELKSILTEDIIIYFRNLFTDHCGWNLRNLLSHGLMGNTSFNSTTADRVIHAFLIISQLRVIEQANA